MTNQNEKKNESKISLAEQFKAELDADLTSLKPLMDDLMNQLHEAGIQMLRSREGSQQRQTYTVERRAIAAVWLNHHATIQSKNRDYLLALRIEEQSTGIKQTVDEGLEEARTRLRKDYAKALAALFDAKGHEAMYGAGTKPSETN